MIAGLLYILDAWFGEGPTDDDPNVYEFIDWKEPRTWQHVTY